MGTNLMRALLLTSASVAMVATAAPTAAYAQEATYQIDIPAQSMGDALRALGKATKQNIVFNGSLVKGKRSAAVRGRMSASEALGRMLQGSGLNMSRGSGGGFVVVPGGNGSGAANGGTQGARAKEAPARGNNPENASRTTAPALTKAPASVVIDSRTGAALKGALVEIIETGEVTATNDLGEFRFPGKAGSYNLRFSYLGYPEYQQFVELRDGRATTAIVLTDGGTTTDIIVTAYQSARAQALNQERTAENTSTVVSGDLLGQFDGNTISEALRRVPGIAFETDGNTGDGTNIIVRGLPSSFNTITLNGQRLPFGDSVGRSPNLSNILADSISQITINKTLLPNQDGSGTGALVEIETKGPLDRPKRYLNVSAERAGSAKGFLRETNLSGTASFRFGADKNFGVSASVQYRKRDVLHVGLNASTALPRYLPLEDDGRPVFSINDIDPRRLFPFEEGAPEIDQASTAISQGENSVKNLAIGLSAEWAIGTHTNLKFDYNRNDSRTSLFARTFQINPFTNYRSMPIPELGGEERLTRVWEGAIFPGAAVANVTRGISYQPERRNLTTTLGLQGQTNFGRWEFDYSASYGRGRNSNEDPLSVIFSRNSFFLTIDRSQLTDEVLANTINGRLISLFPVMGDQVSLPGLNENGLAIVNGSTDFFASDASLAASFARNRRYSGKFSAKYTFNNSFMKYLEAGVYYENSEVTANALPNTSYSFTRSSASNLGLAFSERILDRVGLPNAILVTSRQDFLNFYERLQGGAIPDAIATVYDPPEFSSFRGTREKTIAGYLQANIELGKLQVVGGARFERVKTVSGGEEASVIFRPDGSVDAEWFQSHPASDKLLSGVDNTVLPRVQANYRFADNLIVRAGFYQSIARPNIVQLAGDALITLDQRPFFGPSGNQPLLSIILPNPSLQASVTNNFDLSLEWYNSNIGAIKVGVFMKPTKNPFFSNSDKLSLTLPDGVTLPDDPRFTDPNLALAISKPENAKYTTRFWGVELSAERRFDFLSGLWGGFGIYANYTYTNGKREVRQSFLAGNEEIVRVLPYSTSPKHSGTAALTYARRGLDASLAYTRQARYLIANSDFGLDPYREAISSLDFKATYNTKFRGSDLRIFFEASNLLRGSKHPTQETSVGGAKGVPKVIFGSSYTGGRSLRGGLSISF